MRTFLLPLASLTLLSSVALATPYPRLLSDAQIAELRAKPYAAHAPGEPPFIHQQYPGGSDPSWEGNHRCAALQVVMPGRALGLRPELTDAAYVDHVDRAMHGGQTNLVTPQFDLLRAFAVEGMDVVPKQYTRDGWRAWLAQQHGEKRMVVVDGWSAVLRWRHGYGMWHSMLLPRTTENGLIVAHDSNHPLAKPDTLEPEELEQFMEELGRYVDPLMVSIGGLHAAR